MIKSYLEFVDYPWVTFSFRTAALSRCVPQHGRVFSGPIFFLLSGFCCSVNMKYLNCFACHYLALQERVPSPSQELKELTAIGILEVSRTFARQRAPLTIKKSGRLLKARYACIL